MVEKWSTDQRTQLRRFIGEFLKRVAASNRLSSVHLNFVTDEEATSLTEKLPVLNGMSDNNAALASFGERIKQPLQVTQDQSDFLRRTSVQYQWVNSNARNNNLPYKSFDEYLNCFKSKRRIAIKRERQKVQEEENIRVDAIVGRDIWKYDGLVERMFQIYLSTIDKLVWGRQYLNLEFFKLLAKSDFVDNLCFMCARDRSCGIDLKASEVIAGTFNIVKDGVFYGRYWGCLKEVKNLHFETCYWSAIEFCIQNDLVRMEPGAGGGDYKWARGFDSTLIHSCHYICDARLRRAVGHFLQTEMQSNVEFTDKLRKHSVVSQGERS